MGKCGGVCNGEKVSGFQQGDTQATSRTKRNQNRQPHSWLLPPSSQAQGWGHAICIREESQNWWTPSKSTGWLTQQGPIARAAVGPAGTTCAPKAPEGPGDNPMWPPANAAPHQRDNVPRSPRLPVLPEAFQEREAEMDRRQPKLPGSAGDAHKASGEGHNGLCSSRRMRGRTGKKWGWKRAKELAEASPWRQDEWEQRVTQQSTAGWPWLTRRSRAIWEWRERTGVPASCMHTQATALCTPWAKLCWPQPRWFCGA